jgi:pre-mRNA-splicing factor 18
MDGLFAEIAKKRKEVESLSSDTRPNKYMRKGDLQRMQEQQEQRAREEKEAALAKEAELRVPTPVVSKVSC